MGFSRYCPSSLDLTNFVVRRCRGGVAQRCAGRPRPSPGIGLGIWKSGNLEVWKFGIQNSKSKSVLPKMPARSGFVGNKSSWGPGPIWWHFRQFFFGPETCKKCLFSLAGQWALFAWFGPYSLGLGRTTVPSSCRSCLLSIQHNKTYLRKKVLAADKW